MNSLKAARRCMADICTLRDATRAVLLCLMVLAPLASAQEDVPLTPQQKAILDKIQPEAQKGNRNAQYKLGLLYLGANKFPPDYTSAYKWFSAAAEQGSHNAIYNLGLLEERGFGVDKSIEKAFEHYKTAAEAGVVAANYRLWNIVNENEELQERIPLDNAVRHLMSAAQSGYTPAEAALGYLHLEGIVVAQDLERAFGYLRKAASAGDLNSERYLGMLLGGSYPGYKAQPAQAIKWLEKPAEKGDVLSQVALGDVYAGNHDYQDMEKAIQWYRKAARKDSIDAIARLGFLYADKKSNFYSPEQAEDFLMQAAKVQNMYEAQYRLFNLLYSQTRKKGDVGRKRTALTWLKAAASGNHPEAQFRLARFYLEGEVVPRSAKEAYILLGLSEANGYENATQLKEMTAASMSAVEIAEADSEIEFKAQEKERNN